MASWNDGLHDLLLEGPKIFLGIENLFLRRDVILLTGKPPAVIEKIVDGKMAKFYEEVCLLEQPFIKDQAISIKELIAQKVGKLGENITVRRFARFKVGAPDWTVAQTKPVEAAE